MAVELKISIRAYAKSLHIDEKAVRKAIKEGKIKKGYDPKTKKIVKSAANTEWGFIHKNPKPQRGLSRGKVVEKIGKKQGKKKTSKPNLNIDDDESSEENFKEEFDYKEIINRIRITSDLSYGEAIRRKEILAVVESRMKLEEKERSLVSRAEVDKSLYKLGDTIKKSFLNIPARVVADIRAANTDVEATNILTMEIQAVLSSIANMQYVPPNNNQ